MMNWLPRPLLLMVLLGCLTVPALAQHPGHHSLRVLDPRQGWRTEQGTIEEVSVVVRPKGIYAEVGLYLEFSARDTHFNSGDTLEVELFFTLPENAAVTDSWLWVEGEIVRAEIFDIWTASQIYEDIVRRRRDPSVLYKRSATQYELRIFPMEATQTRRVKLTYVVPMDWTAARTAVPLPTELLRTTKHAPDRLNVITFFEERWDVPAIAERPETDFALKDDPFFGGPHLRATLPWNAVEESITLTYDAPLDDGLFVSETTRDEEQFYQLVLLPAKALSVPVQRKVALLFDYDAAKTTIAQAELLASAQALLKSTLTPTDSFTVILSGLDVRRLSDTWMPANTATVEHVFAEIEGTPLPGYSNLPALIANGLDFVAEQGTGGSLMLLSSSDQVGDDEVANELIRDLQARAGDLVPIHVIDLTDTNFTRYQIGGRTFSGNEYFYTNLTRLSGGNYVSLLRERVFSTVMTRGFGRLGGIIKVFDLHTTKADGFCYARFSSHTQGGSVSLSEPIYQVGKCFGSSSFRVEASGLLDGKAFSERRTLDAPAAADHTLVDFWTAQQINLLEAGDPTNDVISEIITLSLEERVLSRYTAFLALEPSQGGEICAECGDSDDPDGGATGIDDETPQEAAFAVEAFPNPFTTEVTLRVRLPELTEASAIHVAVYNAMGQLVARLPLGAAGLVNDLTLTWNGTNAAGQRVASGPYFIVIRTPQGHRTVKVIFLG